MAFILDTRQFNSQLTKYLNYTQKNVASQVNKRSANIIMKSMQYTRRASASKIRAFMHKSVGKEIIHSEVIKYPKAGKSGKYRKVRPKNPRVTKTLLVYKIYNYWRKRRGQRPVGGKEMGGLAMKFLNSILSSTAYITSGWYPALNLFKRAGSNVSGVKPPSSPKGTASKGGGIVAKPGPVVRSYFYNTAYPPSRSDKILMNVSDIAGKPLSLAMRLEEQDMQKWLEDEMKKTADKVFTNI
jgi:hypothetical protein